MLIKGVEGEELFFGKIEQSEELSRNARIFTDDRSAGFQHLQGPQRNVTKVADRSGDDGEHGMIVPSHLHTFTHSIPPSSPFPLTPFPLNFPGLL